MLNSILRRKGEEFRVLVQGCVCTVIMLLATLLVRIAAILDYRRWNDSPVVP